MQTENIYLERINQTLEHVFQGRSPETLYEPVRYFMQIGGKRIRPILVVMGNELYRGELGKVMPLAAAVEIFHNFTLMHDDIMDRAPLRRGQVTVHEKYNTAQAILSGDIMLVRCYELINQLPENVKTKVLKVFGEVATGVCEGQQLDMDFEKHELVPLESYIEMITLKTAVLLGGSLQLGALAAGADEYDARKLYEIGKYLGISFQLQDDYLDVFGNPDLVGKQTGGDILAGKKTWLMLKAYENGNEVQKAELKAWYKNMGASPEEKVKAVSDLFRATGADASLTETMNHYYQKAMVLLDELNGEKEVKQRIKELAEFLSNRKN